MSGRPLRFLGAIVGLWTLGRLAFLLPSDAVVEMAVRPERPAKPRASKVAMTNLAPLRPDSRTMGLASGHSPRPNARRPTMVMPPSVEMVEETPPEDAPVIASPPSVIPPSPIPALPETPAPARRWSASLWAIARDGGRTLLPGGQLGGTQAGVRVLRRIDKRGDLSASLRLSTPWQGIGREMAVGIDWRPVRHGPVRLLVEQRIALDSGRDTPAALVVAGIGPQPVAPGLVLAAYAQGGAVARERIEPFADGAVRVSTALSPMIDLGLGAWGGAQRDVHRLDVGPTMGIAVPVANRRLRLSLDWRQRVAGQASPDSGAALSLAGDF
jgi:hypothetical protein